MNYFDWRGARDRRKKLERLRPAQFLGRRVPHVVLEPDGTSITQRIRAALAKRWRD